jgi:transglutaminase-like putative cysteine protease
MNQRHSYAVVAGTATLLAAFPLTTIFAMYTWLFYATFAVAAVVTAGILVRTARGPVWTQVLAMMGALLIYLTAVFPSGHEFLRLIPTASTFTNFNDMLGTAGVQIRTAAIPVPDYPGLLLLTTAGVGLVAILVDLAAVGLRRPALAGLPMLAIYSVPVAVLPHSMPLLPFVFAAAGFLWLLVSDSVDRVRRFGRRFTGEGRDVELWEPSPLASAGRRLGVVGLVIAMLLPLALPDFTNGLLERLNGPGTGSGIGPGTGAVSTVNLNALITDNLRRSDAFDMVTVSTNDPSPFYLRFATADDVTNSGFINHPPTGGTPVTKPIIGPTVPKVTGVNSTTYGATVQTVNFDMRYAPTYERLTGVQDLDDSWIYDESTEQVYGNNNGAANNKTYRIQFQHVTYTAAALRTSAVAGEPDASTRGQIQVPHIDQITDLVKLLTKGKTTEYDKVRGIYDYFSPSNNFTYSLDAPPAKSGYAVVDFLNTKKGFCVQYAAALAWLVREAGYQARVAFGFTRGPGAINQTYRLTNLNLHAWTEVFFPGFGWVPFDATPAGSVTGSVQSSYAPDLADPIAAAGGDPDALAPKPGSSASAAPVPGGEINGPQPGATVTHINPLYFVVPAVLIVLLALALMPAVRRRTLRRQRRVRPGPAMAVGAGAGGSMRPSTPDLLHDPAVISAARLDAHAAWAELIDTLVDFDVAVDEAETPRATAVRLRELPGLEVAAQDATGLIARAEERARYAVAPLASDGLDSAVRTVRTAMSERATGRQRLMAAILPRSVTLRWRATWVGWMGRAVRASGRVREAFAVVNPRRLLAGRAGSR